LVVDVCAGWGHVLRQSGWVHIEAEQSQVHQACALNLLCGLARCGLFGVGCRKLRLTLKRSPPCKRLSRLRVQVCVGSITKTDVHLCVLTCYFSRELCFVLDSAHEASIGGIGNIELGPKGCAEIVGGHLPLKRTVFLKLLAPSRRRRFPSFTHRLLEVGQDSHELQTLLVLDRNQKTIFVCQHELNRLAQAAVEEGRVYEIELAPCEVVVGRAEHLHELVKGELLQICQRVTLLQLTLKGEPFAALQTLRMRVGGRLRACGAPRNRPLLDMSLVKRALPLLLCWILLVKLTVFALTGLSALWVYISLYFGPVGRRRNFLADFFS